MADLLVRHSSLKGVEIGGEIIPALIDELPMIAAMACAAQGTTVIKDAAELKVKESNRIRIMVENLSAMGADIRETEDGMIIEGGRPLHGASVDSHLDHRIAMTFAVTALNRRRRDNNKRCGLRPHLLSGILSGSKPGFWRGNPSWPGLATLIFPFFQRRISSSRFFVCSLLSLAHLAGSRSGPEGNPEGTASGPSSPLCRGRTHSPPHSEALSSAP